MGAEGTCGRVLPRTPAAHWPAPPTGPTDDRSAVRGRASTGPVGHVASETMSPAPGPAAPALPDGLDALLDANLAIVTGKGGVGKTTVAATLALAGVASGRRTLLVEVEGRQSFSRAFGTQPWDYSEREFRPDLWGVAIDPAAAVYEYLDLFYGLKRMQWAMERSNAVDFVTTAAPGLRDLLLIGKVYEIESRRRDDGRRVYDLIVLDAPPTGRIVPFLQAPDGVTEIVRVGQIKRQAAQIAEMLDNPSRTQGFVVTLLEEMPVREAVEGVRTLDEAGIRVGPVVANQVTVPRMSPEASSRLRDDLGAEGLRERAGAAGAELTPSAAAAAVDLATGHTERLAMERDLRAELVSGTDRPVLDLPLLTGATFGHEDLEVLADVVSVAVGDRGPRAANVPGWLDRADAP
jgi:anion-transporting  ArsA/GET3 family ATPase